MRTVADVLQACDQDPIRAYDLISEMVIPPDSQVVAHSSQTVDTSLADYATSTSPQPRMLPPTVSPKQSPPRSPRPVTFAFAHAAPLALPHVASPHTPCGAWARHNLARRYRIDSLCSRYTWLDRNVADALFDKNHDCVELVENDVLEMFPLDEPIAFATSLKVPHPSPQPEQPYPPAPQPAQSPHESHNVAEVFREKAISEIRLVAQSASQVSMTSPPMLRMRQELWEKRATATHANALASQTRKPALMADARKKTDEMRKLSAYFLERIRQSPEYHDGQIDLHGLTKEEAIQLVDWKLQDSGRRRFKVITGKGNHSHKNLAILRPALERYLNSRGISFSMCGDGILSVTP